ncbi:MAG TPA: GTP 3',8-cyclase MoaA [Acidimicrobiales bacterium]|jgi:cyclic pyranopterin phosphate synthase|nr:GTP 3',8-cyclase MoaA [Acidimicrobiales bacterium]
MAAAPLVDGFGRVHRDLRISVTDRCNFRCTYCMPVEGMTWLPRSEVLTFEEIERLARICVERFGVDSIRLTGGEPTVRAHLPVLVARLAALRVDDPTAPGGSRPINLALTTNGATLRTVAPGLVEAGLRRVNVSLDTLRRDRFLELTRRDQLDAVLDGIDAAVEAGLAPVKVNAVVMRGVNDDEIVDLAAFGRARGVTVRFIEWMPLDAGGEWEGDAVVRQAEIVAAIDAVFPLEPLVRGSEPAERFAYRDGQGEVGVIPSVSRPFCATCDRIRLTADGQLRACLFAVDETDLRGLLRSGADDDELTAAVQRCVAGKWAGHMIGQVTFVRPRRSMSQIGG